MRLTELHYEATSDVPISKGVRPQQAVGAGLQDVPLVVRQVFFKPQVKGINFIFSYTCFTLFFSVSRLTYCEMWWRVQRRWRSPPRRCTDHWSDGTQKRLTNASLTLCFFVSFSPSTSLTGSDRPNATSPPQGQQWVKVQSRSFSWTPEPCGTAEGHLLPWRTPTSQRPLTRSHSFNARCTIKEKNQ